MNESLKNGSLKKNNCPKHDPQGERTETLKKDERRWRARGGKKSFEKVKKL